VKLTPLVLTKEQVEHYQLPPVMLKETDTSRRSFQERRGVECGSELDALEAIHPGAFGRLVEEAFAPYRDADLETAMSDTASDADDSANEQWELASQDEKYRLEEIQEQVKEIAEEFQPRINEINERYRKEVDALKKEFDDRVSPLKPKLDAVSQDIRVTVSRFSPDLPDRPEADVDPGDEDDWLYESGRSYMEQLSAYHAHKNVTTVDDLEEAASGKICPMCQAEFRNPHPQAIYCSPTCRQAGFRAKNGLPEQKPRKEQAEQRRDLIVAALKADPAKSNRHIAEELGMDHKPVGKVRRELESQGEIPHVVAKKGPRRD
jgi:DNA repair exonuclease SbcCD ATPase subunit